jgi:hypothetical protein
MSTKFMNSGSLMQITIEFRLAYESKPKDI